MTIDINLLRKDKGGDPEVVRQSEKRRFRDGKIVDEVMALDAQWVKEKFAFDEKRKEIGVVQKEITERKKNSKGSDACEDLVAKKTGLEAEATELEKVYEETMTKRDKKLGTIGNLVHDTVPVSQDEDKDNEVVAKWGIPRSFEGKKYQANGFRPHFELLEMIGAVEFESGNDVCGHRGYFLTGPGVLLNQALLNYGLAFMSMRGYTPLQPPFFMKKDLMAKTAELTTTTMCSTRSSRIRITPSLTSISSQPRSSQFLLIIGARTWIQRITLFGMLAFPPASAARLEAVAGISEAFSGSTSSKRSSSLCWQILRSPGRSITE